MEATPEGLAAAAATREVLNKKRKAKQEVTELQSSKKVARQPPTCTHEVARPEGFKEDATELEEAVHGKQCHGSLAAHRPDHSSLGSVCNKAPFCRNSGPPCIQG